MTIHGAPDSWIRIALGGGLRPATAPADADLAGLSRYEVQGELGRGGQATVYLAEDTHLHRKVALKVFKLVHPGDPGTRLRFVREAEVASRLDHPGICTVFDAGFEGEIAYIAMQHLQGESLAHRISRTAGERTPATALDIEGEPGDGEPSEAPSGGPASARAARDEVRQTSEIVEQVARALHAAHEAGVLHRDIKPANIMVEAGGRPVITDFGLARQEDSDLPTLTRTGELFGTPAYMSPEQLTRQAIQLDRRSDVWSLGATLYECLTLHRPFDAATREQLYMGILTHEPPDPRRFNPAIPRDLKVVVATALCKDRDRRYQTAADLAEDLRRVREGEPIRARPVPLLMRAWQWVRREPAKAVAIVALLLAFAAVGYLVAQWPDLKEGWAADLRARREAILQAAYLELGHGRPEVARETFERALKVDSTSIEARAGAALAWLRLEDPAAALAALDAGEDDPRLAGIRGEVLQALGRDEEARQLGKKSGPTHDAMGWFLRGMRAMNRGHMGHEPSFAMAVKHLYRAVFAAPAPRAIYLHQLADAAGHVGDATTCRLVAATLRMHWPNDPTAWTWAGYALRSVDPERALRQLDKALELDPNAVMAHYYQGDILAEMGRRDEAAKSYLKAIEIEPDLAAAWDRLGVNRVRQGRFAEAAHAFDRALELAPKDYMLWHNRGIAAWRLGELQDAERCIRKSTELEPWRDGHWAALMGVLRDQDQHDDALALAEEALKKVMTDKAVIHNERGITLGAMGRISEALAAYEKALELQPQDSWAWNNYALALDEAGRRDEAIAALEKAVKFGPDNVNAIRNLRSLGECFLHLKEGGAAAAAAAERCYRCILGSPHAEYSDHYFLGNALMALDRFEQALAAYDAALKLEPDHAESHCNRGHALGELGRLQEGLESFEEGHRLGQARGNWTYPSDQWIRSVEHFIGVEKELDEIAKGKKVDLYPHQLEDLTHLCRLQRRWAQAAQLWKEAFARDRSSIVDVSSGHPLTAACLAARAGTGQDRGDLDAATQAAWRAQALGWLSERLRLLRKVAEGGRAPRPASLVAILERWEEADALATLREPAALEALPESERGEWREFWAAVSDLRRSLE